MSEAPRNDIERDEQLAALYRAAAHDEPPPALDDAIRAAARRAVASKPRLAGSPFSRSWRVPLSIAALIVLSVSLVTLIDEEGPPAITPPPRAEAPPADTDRKPAAGQSAAIVPLRKDTVEADQVAATASSAPAPLAKRAPPDAFPGVADARDNKVTAPAEKARQSGKEEARREVGAVSAEADRRLAEAKPSRPAEAAARAPVPAAAPATAPAPAAGAASEAKAQLRSEAISADSAARESERARVQAVPAPPAAKPAPVPAAKPVAPRPAPQMAGAIQTYVNLPPEKWLEQIESLRKQGKLEEARTSFAEFRKRYPDYPLPDSLKDLAKP
ncbi:MAG: hypothetical protein HY525_12215 [Betaproteobacteria bacterium]|nr:hypothetical protein [Betaproteobacteria bacterium]